MDASSITKKRNNSTLYSAYTTATQRLSNNPNTRQVVIETYKDISSNQYTNIPKYSCNNFIDFQLQKDVYYGGLVCGNHVIQDISGDSLCQTTIRHYVCPESKLQFTYGPKRICPNTEFNQGTTFINECPKVFEAESVDVPVAVCRNIEFNQGTKFVNISSEAFESESGDSNPDVIVCENTDYYQGTEFSNKCP